MLRTLRIRQLVIVEDLTVEFARGLNLLTGETGAGKSILVDALGLIAGDRADRSLVRRGAGRAVVDALFEIDPGGALAAWARERGDDDVIAEGQIVIRRELAADGGGRALLNGSPCTLTMLRDWTGRLLELHGQHEHQSLLSPERHLELLDRLAGAGETLGQVERAHAAVLEARARRDAIEQAAAERGRTMDELTAALREIDAVGPVEGERDELDRERSVLRNASRMRELLDQVVSLAYDGEPSGAGLATRAARLAEELAGIDPRLEGPAAQLRAAAVEIQDAGASFRDYADRADFDPRRLEEVEARRVALERLCLRFGPDEAALLTRREEMRAELDALRGIDASLDRAREAEGAAVAAYAEAAGRLGKLRRAAAPELAAALEGQFRALALEKARAEVELERARGEEVGDGGQVVLSPRGCERATLLLAANAGEPLAPLQRAASGGELSRVMLAIHAVMDAGDQDRTVVFDEVDAGIGGSVADAVGSRLGGLARARQVLCVTHLPQVAAYADRHMAVRKEERAGRTFAAVEPLDGDEKIGELARMLGGRRSTETSRRHAEELLRAAGRAARGKPMKPGRRS